MRPVVGKVGSQEARGGLGWCDRVQARDWKEKKGEDEAWKPSIIQGHGSLVTSRAPGFLEKKEGREKRTAPFSDDFRGKAVARLGQFPPAKKKEGRGKPSNPIFIHKRQHHPRKDVDSPSSLRACLQKGKKKKGKRKGRTIACIGSSAEKNRRGKEEITALVHTPLPLWGGGNREPPF